MVASKPYHVKNWNREKTNVMCGLMELFQSCAQEITVRGRERKCTERSGVLCLSFAFLHFSFLWDPICNVFVTALQEIEQCLLFTL